MTVPRSMTAGTTLSFRRTDSRFPASQGWTYALLMRVPGYEPLQAAADGDAFVFTATAAQTTPWQPGTYAFSERVSLGDEVHELGTGQLTIRANLATPVAGSDGRTHNERTLVILEAAIEGRVLDGVENFAIGGRTVTKLALPELVKLRDKYKLAVALERGRGRLGSVQFVFGGGAL